MLSNYVLTTVQKTWKEIELLLTKTSWSEFHFMRAFYFCLVCKFKVKRGIYFFMQVMLYFACGIQWNNYFNGDLIWVRSPDIFDLQSAIPDNKNVSFYCKSKETCFFFSPGVFFSGTICLVFNTLKFFVVSAAREQSDWNSCKLLQAAAEKNFPMIWLSVVLCACRRRSEIWINWY